MTNDLWFPKSVLWQFETELMNHLNPYCDSAWGSRKFCATYCRDLLIFIFYKSGLYNIILFCVIPLHFFSVESVFLKSSFHPVSHLPHTSHLQGQRNFPQAQPCLELESEKAEWGSHRLLCICVALSPPDGMKYESCCPKQGMRSV